MADEKEIKVPDIGGATGVDVIELLVKEGDQIEKDTPLITLESDKASMEIPSPAAGVVRSLRVKLGDKLSEGDIILTFSPAEDSAKSKEKEVAPVSEPVREPKSESKPEPKTESKTESKTEVIPEVKSDKVSDISEQFIIAAGPAVRRFARELGVDLQDIQGSGRKSRISKEDVQAFVKQHMQTRGSSSGLSLPSAGKAIDFSQFGEIEVKPLNKIKRLTGTNVHRAWVSIPHVTQFDEADITELEAFRKAESDKTASAGYKLTILAFVCKVVSKALVSYPQFNTSLDPSGESLIYKQYVNIGIAVETPNGLVVPVIRQVDQLSVGEIAKAMADLSTKAREKGLTPVDMQGGCFTISSLGGIGGTAFTPIVNSPEVAILGLSRASIKPVYNDEAFQPRLLLPMSLSYDHRVIDGAEAARFTRFIADSLADIRRIIL